MIYIVLTVFTSVILLIAFKLFEKYQINTFAAILINYLVACVTGTIVLNVSISLSELFEYKWIWICLPLGALFILIFYLISLTAQKISVSVASMANKLSFVMPVIYSIVMLNDPLNTLKFTSVVLALIAVYLATKSASGSNASGSSFYLLPVLVFIGSGLIDVSLNLAKAHYLTNSKEEALFTVCTFFTAFCIGLIIVSFQFIRNWASAKANYLKIRNLIGGIALGIPNFFSIFFIFKSLSTSQFKSSQIFPVLNLSNVVLATTCGYLMFNEKISRTNFVGILLAVASIILILL
ncbi:MAG: EamA/RhaT family transporter [Bacteroidota bacterium]|jgi:drug/metabolite transporter (DMT)-like permease